MIETHKILTVGYIRAEKTNSEHIHLNDYVYLHVFVIEKIDNLNYCKKQGKLLFIWVIKLYVDKNIILQLIILLLELLIINLWKVLDLMFGEIK